MGGWGCPHEVDSKCQKVLNRPCDIGMKGCVLAGRFRFADPSKNRPKQSQPDTPAEAHLSDNDQQQ
jgi:hypothetical protein